MKYLDVHPDVLSWASEELIIPYVSPIDGRVHRYFPDFYVMKKNQEGIIEEIVIEVKPSKQLQPPKKPAKMTRKYVNEMRTYAINQKKFQTAEEFCRKRGLKYMIMTEHELGIK